MRYFVSIDINRSRMDNSGLYDLCMDSLFTICGFRTQRMFCMSKNPADCSMDGSVTL